MEFNVIYKPELRTPSVCGEVLFNGVLLSQGANRITEVQLIQLNQHPEFNAYVTQGVAEIELIEPDDCDELNFLDIEEYEEEVVELEVENWQP